MSHVISMIVHVGSRDSVGIKALRGWHQHAGLPGTTSFKRLDNASDGWGGPKAPEVLLYAGAFDYLHWDSFKSFIESVPWQYPDQLQLLVSGEFDNRFGLWELREGTLANVGGADNTYGLLV